MTEHKIPWLSHRRLDDTEQEHSRRAKGSDDRRGVVHVAESRVAGHDRLNQEDATECSHPSSKPNLILQRNAFEPL